MTTNPRTPLPSLTAVKDSIEKKSKYPSIYCRTPDWTKWKQLIEKSGRLYIRVVGRPVGRLVIRHAADSSDVTLAFEDPQVIPPFSREETDNTDDKDDTDDIDDIDSVLAGSQVKNRKISEKTFLLSGPCLSRVTKIFFVWNRDFPKLNCPWKYIILFYSNSRQKSKIFNFNSISIFLLSVLNF